MNDNHCEQADRVAAYLLAFACRRAPGRRSFCGTYLVRIARRLKAKVCLSFTLEELDGLLALLPPAYEGGREALSDATGAQQALMDKARALIPAVRRTTGARSEDEDCLSVALDVLGLWDPEKDGELAQEIDIPGTLRKKE